MAHCALNALVDCDAPYHDIDHTVQVVLVGVEILSGKIACGEPVSAQEWSNFVVALLCHDLGYLKGACRGDRPEERLFMTGKGDESVTLSSGATGASLTPYHVDRSQRFVAEQFAEFEAIDIPTVMGYIEMTRFPVPKGDPYQDTSGLPGLVRGADLIGQLGDPSYLQKLPRLFREFEEVGANKAMGYGDSKDLRKGYPSFYWHVVSLYVIHAVRYLELSQMGRAVLANLYANREQVEVELKRFYSGKRQSIRRFLRRMWHWAVSTKAS